MRQVTLVMKALVLFITLIFTSLADAQPATEGLHDPRKFHLRTNSPQGFIDGAVAFGLQKYDFNAQALGSRNCANISITNATENARMITAIVSSNDAFTLSSPSEEMFPMTIQAMNSMYISVCFKPGTLGKHAGKFTAYLGTDSTVVEVLGSAIKPQKVAALPKKHNLKVRKLKTGYDLTVDLAQQTPVTLTISNALGTTVRDLSGGDMKEAGSYTFPFDGKNENGESLEPGVYYVKLKAGDFKLSKSITIK